MGSLKDNESLFILFLLVKNWLRQESWFSKLTEHQQNLMTNQAIARIYQKKLEKDLETLNQKTMALKSKTDVIPIITNYGNDVEILIRSWDKFIRGIYNRLAQVTHSDSLPINYISA